MAANDGRGQSRTLDPKKQTLPSQGASRKAAAVVWYGNSIEEEREIFLKILGEQVAEPLRAQITGPPLEDARHLTHRYDKLLQEVEAQVVEVLRSRLKSRGSVSAFRYGIRCLWEKCRLFELFGQESNAKQMAKELAPLKGIGSTV